MTAVVGNWVKPDIKLTKILLMIGFIYYIISVGQVPISITTTTFTLSLPVWQVVFKLKHYVCFAAVMFYTELYGRAFIFEKLGSWV